MSYFNNVYEEEGYEGKLNSFKVKEGNFKGGFKEGKGGFKVKEGNFKEMRVKRKTPDVVEITFRPTKKRKHNWMR